MSLAKLVVQSLAAAGAATTAATFIIFAAIWVVSLDLGHVHLLSAVGQLIRAQLSYRQLSMCILIDAHRCVKSCRVKKLVYNY